MNKRIRKKHEKQRREAWQKMRADWRAELQQWQERPRRNAWSPGSDGCTWTAAPKIVVGMYCDMPERTNA